MLPKIYILSKNIKQNVFFQVKFVIILSCFPFKVKILTMITSSDFLILKIESLLN